MMALMPSQSYANSLMRIAAKPQTIRDHIRRRRLASKMLQRNVAKMIGVDQTSIHNCEANKSNPDMAYMPAIIGFLGYNPLPPAHTLAERLVRHRTTLGLTQEQSAKCIGLDPGTLAHWERDEREPTGAFMLRVNTFLNDGANRTLRQ